MLEEISVYSLCNSVVTNSTKSHNVNSVYHCVYLVIGLKFLCNSVVTNSTKSHSVNSVYHCVYLLIELKSLCNSVKYSVLLCGYSFHVVKFPLNPLPSQP